MAPKKNQSPVAGEFLPGELENMEPLDVKAHPGMTDLRTSNEKRGLGSNMWLDIQWRCLLQVPLPQSAWFPCTVGG